MLFKTTAFALIIAVAQAKVAFNNCDSLSYEGFLATMPSVDKVQLGPQGTYFSTNSGGCSMLNFMAPGFDQEHPEAYKQFIDATLGAHKLAAGFNTTFFKASDFGGVEKREAAACGQSCDPNGGDLCPIGCGSCQLVGSVCVAPGSCVTIHGCR
jgi:hypothetical protein